MVIDTCKDYQVFDAELFENLELYMQDKENKYDLKKGLLFLGGIGSGKTELMKLLKEYAFINKLHKHFRFEKMNKLEYLYQKNGYEMLEYYTNGLNLCIDDIGVESGVVNNYGNKINTFEDLLIGFYEDAFKNGYLMHGTTNLNGKQFKENYSSRIIDRMRAMFNIIKIDNKSWRK